MGGAISRPNPDYVQTSELSKRGDDSAGPAHDGARPRIDTNDQIIGLD